MKVNVREFRANLAKYLKLSKDEVIFITKNGVIIAELKGHK